MDADTELELDGFELEPSLLRDVDEDEGVVEDIVVGVAGALDVGSPESTVADEVASGVTPVDVAGAVDWGVVTELCAPWVVLGLGSPLLPQPATRQPLTMDNRVIDEHNA